MTTHAHPPLSPFFDLKVDKDNNKYLEVYCNGFQLLRLSALNKGTAFTDKERIDLGFDGLLPPRVVSQEEQVKRLYKGFVTVVKAQTPVEHRVERKGKDLLGFPFQSQTG